MQELPQAYCPVPLAQFLSLAIEITKILGRIHAANVIHKDINESIQNYIPQIGEFERSLAEALATLAKDFK
jgi:serine/threonine protein kinase